MSTLTNGVRKINELIMIKDRALIITTEDPTSYKWGDIPDGSLLINPLTGGMSVKLTGETAWVPAGIKNDGTICIAKDSKINIEKFKVLTTNNGDGTFTYLNTDGHSRTKPLSSTGKMMFELELGTYIERRNHLEVHTTKGVYGSAITGEIKEEDRTRFSLTNNVAVGDVVYARYIQHFNIGNPYPRFFINNDPPPTKDYGDFWLDTNDYINYPGDGPVLYWYNGTDWIDLYKRAIQREKAERIAADDAERAARIAADNVLQAEIDDLARRMGIAESNINNLKTRMSNAESRLSNHEGRIAALEAALDALGDAVKDIKNTPPPPSYTPGSQLYSSPGSHSWKVPDGTTSVTIDMAGGGGGGGGGDASRHHMYKNQAGAGGTAGSVQSTRVTVTPGSNISITVGAGGKGGLSDGNKNGGGTSGGHTDGTLGDPGGNGGNSSFGSLITCTGGTGGQPANQTATGGVYVVTGTGTSGGDSPTEYTIGYYCAPNGANGTVTPSGAVTELHQGTNSLFSAYGAGGARGYTPSDYNGGVNGGDGGNGFVRISW